MIRALIAYYLLRAVRKHPERIIAWATQQKLEADKAVAVLGVEIRAAGSGAPTFEKLGAELAIQTVRQDAAKWIISRLTPA